MFVADDQVSELDDLGRQDGLATQPVPPDLVVVRKRVLGEPVRVDARRPQAADPLRFDDVDAARGTQEAGLVRRRLRRRPERSARALAREPEQRQVTRVSTAQTRGSGLLAVALT